MAISVGRLSQQHPRVEQLLRYGPRLTALTAYAAAVAVALTLLAPVFRENPPADAPVLVPAQAYTVRPGDTLALVAAEQGMSVARLLALNPDVEPLALEPGERLRIR